MTDWFGGRGLSKWLTGLVAGGKANDWLIMVIISVTQWCSDMVYAVMRWRGDTVMRWCGDFHMVGGKVKWDWFGGRGQGKWLTGLVAGGKANDWLTLTRWCGGRGQGKWLTGLVAGQGKWLTGLVAGGKANDWLMDYVTQWCGDACDAVVGGKANDWLVWWQGAMANDWLTQWCGDAVVGGKANDWLVWWQGARQMTDWFGGRGQGKWLTNAVMRWRGDAVTWWCSDAVMRW